ncbi:MAG TPA: preprotein translocase subunit YajC [bacterium (Candidatus Stahlbacteria)]|nr:preprotein translocase subunit YajC [Candidatus Stahlbacteria bacterium]
MAAPEGGGEGMGITAILPLIFIFVILYLLIILPQQKRQKKHLEMISQLKKGDKVVTSGGIHGTIVKLNAETVVIQVSQKSELTVDKSSISKVFK